MSNKSPYKGVLAHKIVVPSFTKILLSSEKTLSPNEIIKKQFHTIMEQKLAKLPALFAHYGVKPNSENGWWLLPLVLQMAEQHVTGFKLTHKAKEAGQPPEWQAMPGLLLWAQVKNFQESKGWSIPVICNHLAKQPEYKDKVKNGSSLRARYNEVVKSHPLFFGIAKNHPYREAVEAAALELVKNIRDDTLKN